MHITYNFIEQNAGGNDYEFRDELIDFDIDLKEIERNSSALWIILSGTKGGSSMPVQAIEQIIENTSEELQQKIDWTSVWGKSITI